MSFQSAAATQVAKTTVKLSKDFAQGTGFLQELKNTASYIPKLYKRIVSDSFTSSVKTVFRDEKNAKDYFIPIVGGVLLNGATIGYAGLNAIDDQRSVFNLGGLKDNLYTDPDAVMTTAAISAGTGALAAVPTIGGMADLGGAALKGTSTNGMGKVVGAGLSGVGKASKAVVDTSLKAGGLIGKTGDFGVKLAGKFIGKDYKGKALSKMLGKHFIWIQALIALRMGYKYINVDMPQHKAGIGTMGIGGRVLGYDYSDPRSATYGAAYNFEEKYKARLEANKNGLPGKDFGLFVERKFRQIGGLV